MTLSIFCIKFLLCMILSISDHGIKIYNISENLWLKSCNNRVTKIMIFQIERFHIFFIPNRWSQERNNFGCISFFPKGISSAICYLWLGYVFEKGLYAIIIGWCSLLPILLCALTVSILKRGWRMVLHESLCK